MLPTFQRYGARVLALLGLVLVTSSSNAQVTYSKSFPAPTTVDTFSGSTAPTTPGSPTFNRPIANGNLPPASLSAIGTAVSYSAKTFTIPTDGAYNIAVDSVSPAGWDNYIFLYSGSFDPANPLTNGVAGNEAAFGIGHSGFTGLSLTAGTYVLVTTAYDNGVVGSFTGSVKPTPTTGSPVFTASGDTTPTGGSPTYNRLAGTSGLSGTGTNVYYTVHSFTAPTTGTYTITSSTTYENYVFLYHDSFNPADPLTNVLAAVDGYPNSGTLTGQSLTAGTTYYIVETTYYNGVTGPYTLNVSTTPVVGSNVYTSSGTTAPTSPSPTFNRPNSGTAPFSLSTSGTAVYYNVKQFTVATTGSYNVVSQTVAPASWDNFTALYQNSFDPASPLTNGVIANDDLNGAASSGFTVTLNAGTTYFLVTTSYSNGKTGTFTNTVTPAVGTVVDSYTGTTVGAPTFNRPIAGTPPTTLSGAGTAVHYDAHPFTPTTSGTYTFTSNTVSPAAWDNFVVLYQGTFTPGSPLTNAKVANDGATSSLVSFDYALTAGTAYTVVTTAFSNSSTGTFSNTISQAAPPVLTYSDGLSAGSGATYNRVDANGSSVPTALSTTATATYYQAKSFTVPTTGSYSVLSTANAPANWNNYTALYSGTFTATSPLTNVLLANDNQPTADISGFAGVTLNAGTTYTLVTAGNTNSDFGTYDVAVAPILSGGTVANFSGNLTAGTGLTFNRPVVNGNSAPTTLSGITTYYKTNTFTVPTTGNYQISSTSVTPANWDNFVVLYGGTFTPATPLTNAVAANDTLTAAGTAGFVSIPLTAGTTYTLVTTGSTASSFGAYNVSVAPVTSGPDVINYSDATTLGSGGPTFNRPFASGNTNTPPTAVSAIGTSVYYVAHPFTVPTTGVYTITATAATNYGIAAYLYTAPFSAASPLTNILAGDNPNSTASVIVLTQTLTAGTQYVIVSSVYSNGAGGSFTTKVTSGSNTIPDGNAAGLSLTLTVPDNFTISALNGITVQGLKHPRAGDLVATLTHGTVSIELFDRVGAVASGDFGSSNAFNGDYAFANGGSDLEAAGATAVSPIPDFTTGGITYAPDLNGTAGQSSTLTGDFTAFNGLSVSGDWTLKIADLATQDLGTYNGFSITVTADSASVSGKITLDSIVATAVPQTITFVFTPTAGGTPITKTAQVGPNGLYTLTGLPKAAYTVRIKGWKYLAVSLPVDTTSGNQTSVNATLTGGDANNDNTIDIGDFGILVNTYGNTYDVNTVTLPDPNVEADFNGDGVIDIGDFGILVNSYGSTGAP